MPGHNVANGGEVAGGGPAAVHHSLRLSAGLTSLATAAAAAATGQPIPCLATLIYGFGTSPLPRTYPHTAWPGRAAGLHT